MALPSAEERNVLHASVFPVLWFCTYFETLYVQFIITRKKACPSRFLHAMCVYSCYLNKSYTEFSGANLYVCDIFLLRKE